MKGTQQMSSEAVDSFSSKVSINVMTNIVRTIVMALVGFMMVPYYLNEFGMATYAIIPLITTITTYFLAMSDSLANAFTRYTAIAVHNGDPELMNHTFSSSVIGMFRCVMGLMPLILAISIAAPYIFSTGDASALSVQLAFFLVILSTLMISFGACMSSVFMAYNKMYITYNARIVHCVLQVGLVVAFFLLRGASLTLIGVSYIIASSVFLLIMAVYLKHVCPSLKLSRSYYDPKLLKKIGRLGTWTIIAEFGSLMFIQASMVVVNLMLGSELQGSFSIAANVISMVNTACASVAVASTPLVYRCYSHGDSEGMAHILKVFTKFSGLLMAFPIAFVIIFMDQIIGVWIGPGNDAIYPLLKIMLPIEVAICAVSSLIEVPIVCEKLKPIAMITILLGASNIVLATLLIRFTDLGIESACISWVATIGLLKVIIYPYYSSKLTSDKGTRYYPSIVFSLAAFIVVMIIGTIASGMFTLPTTWTAIILTFFPAFIVYFVVVMRFMFTKDERSLAITFLPGFMQRIVSGRTHR